MPVAIIIASGLGMIAGLAQFTFFGGTILQGVGTYFAVAIGLVCVFMFGALFSSRRAHNIPEHKINRQNDLAAFEAWKAEEDLDDMWSRVMDQSEEESASRKSA